MDTNREFHQLTLQVIRQNRATLKASKLHLISMITQEEITNSSTMLLITEKINSWTSQVLRPEIKPRVSTNS